MTNSSNRSDTSSLESLHDSPGLILGVDGRPWGSRAVLSRAVGDEDLDGIIDSFEVSDDSGLWDRLKDLVVRVEEAYGRVPMTVRIAALPDRSHSYELEKLRRHLATGSTVDVVAVDASYTRRPRANDSAKIKLKSEKVSAMLAVGVVRLREPGDTVEIGDQQLTDLAEGVSSSDRSDASDSTDVADAPVDLRPEAANAELGREPATSASKPLLVAVSAGVMAVLAVTGVLGYRSSQEPEPVPSTTTVVAEIESTPNTTVSPAVSPTTVPPTTIPPPTEPVEPDVPANGGPIDLGFLNDEPVPTDTTVPVEPSEPETPANGGPIDLGFLNDEPTPATTSPANTGPANTVPANTVPEAAAAPENGGPIDLGFLDEEPDAGAIDLSFLPPAE